MEINIKPEDIDKYVKDAIMECTFGKSIKDAIDKSMKGLFSGYGNPIDELMRQELKLIVSDYLKQESVKPIILEAIAKTLTPASIETIITFGVMNLQKEINSYKDY